MAKRRHLPMTALAAAYLCSIMCAWSLGCSANRKHAAAPVEKWPGGERRVAFEYPEVFDRSGGAKGAVQLASAELPVPESEERVTTIDSRARPWYNSLRQPELAVFTDESGGTSQLLPTPEVLLDHAPISDTFIETDVRQALQSIASQAEAEFIVDDQVRGAVTANIEDASLAAALDQVLFPLGFVYREVDGIYYVGVDDPDSALFAKIAERYRYSALHRGPEELAENLPKRYQKFVRVASQGGWLIVEAPRDHGRRILSELDELDQPVPQVVLEALICVYSPETNFRFGFDMESGVQLFGRSADVAIQGLSLAGSYGAPAAGNLNDFNTTRSLLRALEQKGYVKIRAAPRVMAQDGEKARIHIGRESFFSVQPDQNNFLFRQDIQQVESGIMLEIIPRIREPNVLVQIERAEVSEDIRSDETQANSSDRFPLINRRSVATTVHVRDGETIVIGGLTQRQNVNVVNKVPVLGSIPIAGKLFQRVERQDQKVEVAIFISPRIIQECCDATALPSTHVADRAGDDRASGDRDLAP